MSSMTRAQDQRPLDLREPNRREPVRCEAGRHEGVEPQAESPQSESIAVFRARIDAGLGDPGYTIPLSTLIETEIIPRLVVAHAGDHGPAPVPTQAGGTGQVTPEDIEAMLPLALHIDADQLLDHVEGILARGVSVDGILVDLLAPVARLLGEYWEEDRCDFVDVTMGLWRLQEVVHELATRVPADRSPSIGGHRALFASMPGDQHSFGTVVIDELFRREGWLTDRMSEVETPDLLRRAGEDWFDVIGLTISCDCHIASLGAIIVALRNVSRNPRVAIMVGGRVFGIDPGLAARVGSDGTARDAKLALGLADTLVRSRQREAAGYR